MAEGQKVFEAVRERAKLYWGIAAAFLTSGLLMILTISVLAGWMPIGAAFAASLLAISVLATLFLMDVAWEGWGVKLFTVITYIVVFMMFANMIFGRALGP